MRTCQHPARIYLEGILNPEPEVLCIRPTRLLASLRACRQRRVTQESLKVMKGVRQVMTKVENDYAIKTG